MSSYMALNLCYTYSKHLIYNKILVNNTPYKWPVHHGSSHKISDTTKRETQIGTPSEGRMH